MSIGGWDTHFNQGGAKGSLANNLSLLGQGIAGLEKELGPVFNDTVIVVMSEFGRTVRENGTKGTDHGRGNVMWVLGGAVRGKQIYGNWPGLSAADAAVANGGTREDVRVTTDFRAVLTPIFRQHWGLSREQTAIVLPMPSSAETGAIDLLIG
jgi:uncharacterized protein (DUF1501 family)